MKSFEHRIRKLEQNLKVDKQDEQIIIILRNYYTDCAEKYNSKCPYLKEDDEDSSGCPLYEERLKKARERTPDGLIMFTLPCFKEEECPLCLDPPGTPTGQRKKSDKTPKRKENE